MELNFINPAEDLMQLYWTGEIPWDAYLDGVDAIYRRFAAGSPFAASYQ